MNDIQLHTKALVANPCDKVLALALADHAEEALGLTRYAALRYVCRIRRAHFYAEAMTAASALFTPLSRSNQAVRQTCRLWCWDRGYNGNSVVLIRHGYGQPKHTNADRSPLRALPLDRGQMLTPAHWLLKRHRPALYRNLITRRLWRTVIVDGVKCRPWGRGVQWTGVLQCWPGEEQVDQVGEQYYADAARRIAQRAVKSV